MLKFETVREFALHTRTAVLDGEWDEEIPYVGADCSTMPCSIGTKLAVALTDPVADAGCVPEFPAGMYEQAAGRRAAAAAIGCSEPALDMVLSACGAGAQPFGGRWDKDRATVWHRLALVECAPDYDILRSPSVEFMEFLSTDQARDRVVVVEAMHIVGEANRAAWHERYGFDLYAQTEDGPPPALVTDMWGYLQGRIRQAARARPKVGFSPTLSVRLDNALGGLQRALAQTRLAQQDAYDCGDADEWDRLDVRCGDLGRRIAEIEDAIRGAGHAANGEERLIDKAVLDYLRETDTLLAAENQVARECYA